MLEDASNLIGFGLIALFGFFLGCALNWVTGRAVGELDLVTALIWASVMAMVVALCRYVVLYNRPITFPHETVLPDRMTLDGD
jgi:hypothetical protein